MTRSGAALLCTLAFAGCHRESAVPAAELLTPPGQVVTRRAALCSPGVAWDRHVDGVSWTFRREAFVDCWVNDASKLSVLLYPAPESAGARFRVAWDGRRISPRSVELAASGLAIEVPRDGLAAGRHELSLARTDEGRVDGRQLPAETAIRWLGFEVDGKRTPVSVGRLARWRLLGEFLGLGVAGRGRSKYAGWLFDGPGRHALAVDVRAPVVLHLAVENSSDAPANLVVESGAWRDEHALEAGTSQSIAVPLAPGRQAVSLAVRGRRGSLYLVGDPFLKSAAGAAAAVRTPTVVVITLDTTRRDALGAYGASWAQTPHLDAFARRASRFERAVSTSSWTLPAHASLFTGTYPSQHGAGYRSKKLPLGATTLAARFGAAGYRTVGIVGGELCKSRFGVAGGFQLYVQPEGFSTTADDITALAVRVLDEQAEAPLFLFLNYFDPHAPYGAPPEFERRLDVARRRERLAGLPLWRRTDAGDIDAWREILNGGGSRAPAALDYVRTVYQAEVAFVDEQIGALFAALKVRSRFDDALIVVVGDHGESLGEGGHFSHAERLDPELVEVPLLIKWPGQREGHRVDQLVSGVDLFPTILAAAGLRPPPSEGLVLTQAGFAGRRVRRVAYSEEHASPYHPFFSRIKPPTEIYGLDRSSARHLVWVGGESCAEGSPGAWRARPCTGAPDLLARIRERLGSAPTEDLSRLLALSAEERRALRALGYL